MATLVSLEYPNGRTHEAEVPEDDLKPGAEFELYGRRWRAIYRTPPLPDNRYATPPQPRLLCRQAT